MNKCARCEVLTEQRDAYRRRWIMHGIHWPMRLYFGGKRPEREALAAAATRDAAALADTKCLLSAAPVDTEEAA